MKLVKCNRCALINTESDTFCRRCKQDLATNPLPQIPVQNKPQQPRKQFSLSQYVLVIGVVIIVFGISYGVYTSYRDVKARDEKRIETKHNEEAGAAPSQ